MVIYPPQTFYFCSLYVDQLNYTSENEFMIYFTSEGDEMQIRDLNLTLELISMNSMIKSLSLSVKIIHANILTFFKFTKITDKIYLMFDNFIFRNNNLEVFDIKIHESSAHLHPEFFSNFKTFQNLKELKISTILLIN